MAHRNIHGSRLRTFGQAALGLCVQSCSVGPQPEVDGSGPSNDSERQVDEELNDTQNSVRSPSPSSIHEGNEFWNPYMALAEIEGGTPLFEQLNDDAGQRYVVGEGQFQDSENSEVQAFPSVMTMVAAVPEKEELSTDSAADLQLGPASKLTPSVLAHLDESQGSSIEVAVSIVHQEEGIQASLDRAMAQGRIHDRYDSETEREILLEERRDRIASATASMTELITSAGGTVLAQGLENPYVIAEVSGDLLAILAERDDVSQVDVTTGAGGPLAVADGLAHQHGAQIRQFVTSAYVGEGPTSASEDDLLAAIIEPNFDGPTNDPASFHTTHGAWRESSSVSAFRYPAEGTGMWECDGVFLCTSQPSFNEPPGYHATNIAGIIFGDLTYPQIPAVVVAEREPSSGFAREARAHLFLADGVNASVRALEAVASLATPAHVVNNSYQWNLATACAGDSLLARTANQVFLDGTAVFSAAGNSGGTSANCQVRSPADAIGSFTVGAHMHAGGTNLDVRTAGIWDDGLESSAWGGNGTQGQNRSVVSITAAGRRTYRIAETGSIDSGASGGKTSFATAVVTATALDVMDFHMSGGSTWIDAPGALYATLLVMGDRQGTGAKRVAGADHRWGVGRLRARKLGAGSMDGPWYWFHGATCIANGDTWDFDTTGGNMPADIESVKAAAYWYDRRHDGSDGSLPYGEVANINISLRTSVGSGGLVQSDTDGYDNKAFVYEPSWPSLHLILRMSGGNLFGHHDPSCGGAAPNSTIKVYYTIFAEDDDREDPTYDPITGEGIYPESL